MTNDEFLPFVMVIATCSLVFGMSYLGFMAGEQTAEEKTIVYCMEQPSACKVKYDFYKFEEVK